MSVEITIPELGESVYEVQILQWLKQQGDPVRKDEDLVQIDSEKATLEIPSPATGTLEKILKSEETFCTVGDVIGVIDESEPSTQKAAQAEEETGETETQEGRSERETPIVEKPPPQQTTSAEEDEPAEEKPPPASKQERAPKVMPAAERVLAEFGLNAKSVEGTGPGGRLLKEDVLRFVEQEGLTRRPAERGEGESESAKATSPRAEPPTAGREEEVVPMSMIRRHIAKRLVEAQQQAALLTTFNEVDMSAVMELRQEYRQRFHEKHGVKLGFMSFFAKAAVEALKRYPQLNAEIRDRSVVYRNYYDIGAAIGSGKGLVVPVLRNVDGTSFAEIEQSIRELAERAEQGKLQPEELEGGTFTISNGGVYGSLLSTPIVNPPQSGILGLHTIQDRPVARSGEVVIRPMMYLALTYDHRIVDGREAVSFLVAVKELIEDPASILLEL